MINKPVNPTLTPTPDEELAEYPRVTKAAPDFNCWMWAAIPPWRGKINISKAADRFDVSRTTMRRWLTQPGKHQLTRPQLVRAQQLAILRGHGDILWPDLDSSSRERLDLVLSNATAAVRMINQTPERIPEGWRPESGSNALQTHSVLLIWWPHAAAWSITTTCSEKTTAKIRGSRYEGQIIEEHLTPNRYAGDVIKHSALIHYSEHLCITPRSLIPYGRSEAIRRVRPMDTPRLQL